MRLHFVERPFELFYGYRLKSEDMPDRYQNFNELSQNENAYVVEQNPVPNSI